MKNGEFYLGSYSGAMIIGEYNAETDSLEQAYSLFLNMQENTMMVMPLLFPDIMKNKITDKVTKVNIPVTKFLFVLELESLKLGSEIKDQYLVERSGVKKTSSIIQ